MKPLKVIALTLGLAASAAACAGDAEQVRAAPAAAAFGSAGGLLLGGFAGGPLGALAGAAIGAWLGHSGQQALAQPERTASR